MLGSGGAKPTAFDRYHPAVAFSYFACVLAFGMAAMQPVYLALSLAAALSYSIVLRGVRATLRTALWQMPLILVMAVANPLFSAMGSTELFRIGLRAFYLESLVFGACMGAMLACVLLWFSNASRVLSSDKVMALFGNAAPRSASCCPWRCASCPSSCAGAPRWATCSGLARPHAPWGCARVRARSCA